MHPFCCLSLYFIHFDSHPLCHLSNLLPMWIWVTSRLSQFWPVLIDHSRTSHLWYKNKAFLLDVYLMVELLSQRECDFECTSNVMPNFYKVFLLLVLISNTRIILWMHVLSNTWNWQIFFKNFFLLTICNMVFHGGLHVYFPAQQRWELLILCSLAMSVSFIKHLFTSFAQTSLWVICILIIWRCTCYILDIILS